MEKRLHNTRHAARQARNSTGRAGGSNSNSNTTSGVSTTAAEKTTATTASTAKAEVSVPSPLSEPTSHQYQQQQREQPVSPGGARYRPPQQFSGRQNDSTDEEAEEMDDDAKSPQLAAPTSPAASAPATPSANAPSASPEQMYEGFQAWALRTYGDSAKTKTVTRKKYQRILKILRGEEQTSAENSKFRFWVKAKGFKTGLPQGHPQQTVHKAALIAAAAKTPPEQLLFVPCSKVKKGGDGETTVYKRVAVVENFFEIIYGVHVEMDGRGGKHAGQKRTYKAIAELYAFLPREAVTHFLMSCSDCQKRMHLTNGALSAATVLNTDSSALNSSSVAPAAVTGTPAGSPGYQSNNGNNNNNNNKSASQGGASGSAGASCQSESGTPRDVKFAGGATAESSPASSPGDAASDASSASTARAAAPRIPRVSAAQLDFSVPITTAYLKHMRSLGLSDEDAFNPREDSTLGSDELSEDEATPNYDEDDAASPDVTGVDSKEVSGDVLMAEVASTPGSDDGGGSAKGSPATARRPCPDGGPRSSEDAMEAEPQQPLNMTARPVLTPAQPPVFAGLSGAATGEHGFTAERAMAQSPLASTSGGAGGEQTPDDLSAGTKEEDEEDDDDEQDKLDISSYDPERLKAFNMFVRLFVDENLDRMVPISRQPKEKIQAIIDSCGRQFPEFAERARKRIRTYLKSCRRTKRTRDLNGWDGRTAVPHLTSPLAEQILASACENETNNAKRMRLGLQPLPMELDVPVRPTTPGYHVTLGVGSASGGLASVPSSVSTSVGPVANNVSSQLISRLTSPIVTTSNGQLSTSSALMPVTTGTLSGSNVVSTTGVEATTVCPFHMHHHHHQQQFHQHFTSSANSSSSNGTLSSPAAVVTSSPMTSFMNGGTTMSPHTHHHHKCFNSAAAAATTNGVGLNSAAGTPNGHHYHVHHRHANSGAATALGTTSVSSSPAASNSPTDLSVKKCNGSSGDRPAATMALKYSLNPTEVNAVKQLIAGYRESAAFLLRSADELEQLLLQQN